MPPNLDLYLNKVASTMDALQGAKRAPSAVSNPPPSKAASVAEST